MRRGGSPPGAGRMSVEFDASGVGPCAKQEKVALRCRLTRSASQQSTFEPSPFFCTWSDRDRSTSSRCCQSAGECACRLDLPERKADLRRPGTASAAVPLARCLWPILFDAALTAEAPIGCEENNKDKLSVGKFTFLCKGCPYNWGGYIGLQHLLYCRVLSRERSGAALNELTEQTTNQILRWILTSSAFM